MPSPFDDLDEEISAVVGEAFGEPCTIIYRSVSQYAGAVQHPGRPPHATTGVFSSGPLNSRLDTGGRGAMQAMTRMVSETPVLWLSAAAVAALPHAVKLGDAVTLAGRPGITFVVASFSATDTGDLELHLTREDAA